MESGHKTSVVLASIQVDTQPSLSLSVLLFCPTELDFHIVLMICVQVALSSCIGEL